MVPENQQKKEGILNCLKANCIPKSVLEENRTFPPGITLAFKSPPRFVQNRIFLLSAAKNTEEVKKTRR
ncbi:hypothetical protein Ancab_013070 [Ancistrocladus abbreviatus]